LTGPEPIMLDKLKSAVRNVPDFPEPGIQFKDITPILADHELMRFAVDTMAARWADAGITKVIGIESRGFLLGAMLAERMDVGFVPVRKMGKLPYTTLQETYDLEYGTDTIEMHIDALSDGDRVLIHDDVIATGGTAAASHRLVESAGAQLVGYCFLIELSFLKGRNLLDPSIPMQSLLDY
jgi:adenine phosphoribosyltransferase